jgi:hypothetical protein
VGLLVFSLQVFEKSFTAFDIRLRQLVMLPKKIMC